MVERKMVQSMKTFKQFFKEDVAGNEFEFFTFFVSLIGKKFPYIGKIKKVSLPGTDIVITDPNQEIPFDRSTFPNAPTIYKADIVVNNKGVSLKQRGGSNVLNWITSNQSKRIFPNSHKIISDYARDVALLKAPVQVTPDSLGIKESDWERIINWSAFDGTIDGKSENIYKPSPVPADIVVMGPKSGISLNNISVYNKEDYFENNKDNLIFLFRRILVGQQSSKHPGKEASNSKTGRRSTNKEWQYEDLDWVKDPELVYGPIGAAVPVDGMKTYVAVNYHLRSKK